jgi:hypothetical protein
MRFTLWLAVLAGAAAMTGCAPTVAIHPLYTSQNLVNDLPLEGTWASGDGGEVWQVQKVEDGYEAAPVDAKAAADGRKYAVHLLRLQTFEFLDVTSKSDPEVGVPGHLFGKIRMEGGKLYVSSINEKWLQHMIDDGFAPQSTIGEGQQIVLIAPTRELQRFIVQHAADRDAWDDDEDGLHRLH